MIPSELWALAAQCERVAVLEGLRDADRSCCGGRAAARVEPGARRAGRSTSRLALELEDGRTRRDGADEPTPAASAEKPRSPPLSSAQDLPSRTAFGDSDPPFVISFPRPTRIAASGRCRSARERHVAAANVGDRAVAVPLHLEQPVIAFGTDPSSVASIGRYRRNGNFSAGDAPRRACARSTSSAPCRRGARARAPTQPSRRSPWQTDGEPAVRLLLQKLVRPRSQISTVPAPYWPLGISPSNFAYSIGWSSTWHCEMLLPRLERHALRHRPRGQRAVALERKS
jgi:hypothetical protein